MTINRTHLAGFPELFSMEPYQTIDRASSNYKAGWNACIRKAEAAIAAQAQAAPEAEPVYQARAKGFESAWSDCDKKQYETFQVYVSLETRVLYTAPQHDAELVELLHWLRQSINCNAENDRDKCGAWISTKHPMIQRIDAKLATLKVKP